MATSRLLVVVGAGTAGTLALRNKKVSDILNDLSQVEWSFSSFDARLGFLIRVIEFQKFVALGSWFVRSSPFLKLLCVFGFSKLWVSGLAMIFRIIALYNDPA